MSTFDTESTTATQNPRLQTILNTALLRQYTGRKVGLTQLPDAEKLRSLAGQIKQHTLDHLDHYLELLRESVQRNGGHFHLAANAEEATRIILKIATDGNCRRVIKSKSMVSEEIDLRDSFEKIGVKVTETDLGEFIVQIGKDQPSHLVAPIVHLDKEEVARRMSEHFHSPLTTDPKELTMQARHYLREEFRQADLGMTGGNFVVAETGHVCVVENEGNARQSITTPRILVSLIGIEKLIPRFADLSVLLKLLARSATGQAMTCYTSLFNGPRKPGETDGPEEFHLVLIDNGRTEILAGEYRETLRCIRCGACLNACPVYRKIGGHAYGNIYSGPIGALISPLFKGLEKFPDLPRASSLCGSCGEVCPVKIDIPKHLVNLRRDIVSSKIDSWSERFAYRLWAWSMRTPFRYRWVCRLQKLSLRRRATGGWISKLPNLAAGWTQQRDMPAPAPKTFAQLWKKQ